MYTECIVFFLEAMPASAPLPLNYRKFLKEFPPVIICQLVNQRFKFTPQIVRDLLQWPTMSF